VLPLADDLVHVVAYPGDVTGDRMHTAADLARWRLLRNGMASNTAFSAYPLASRNIMLELVADNGAPSDSIDRTAMQNLILGRSVAGVPSLPTADTDQASFTLVGPTGVGSSQLLAAAAGQMMPVTVKVSELSLSAVSADVDFYYDPSKLSVRVRAGALSQGIEYVDQVFESATRAKVSFRALLNPQRTLREGSLVQLEFTVRSGQTTTQSVGIDLAGALLRSRTSTLPLKSTGTPVPGMEEPGNTTLWVKPEAALLLAAGVRRRGRGRDDKPVAGAVDWEGKLEDRPLGPTRPWGPGLPARKSEPNWRDAAWAKDLTARLSGLSAPGREALDRGVKWTGQEYPER